MNKKTLIKKADDLLQEYKELQKEKRNYDNHGWHAVNVKRYNDYVDIKELLKKMKVKKYFINDIIEEFTKDGEIIEDAFYYNFLDGERDQLNYEISDIKEITEGAKDEHASFQFIDCQEDQNRFYKNRYIYFLGSSGGWACFQDNMQGRAEELEAWVEDIKAGGEYYPFNEYQEEIKESINDLEQAIEEISYIKEYIKNFNKNLSFELYLKDQIEMEQKLYKEEQKERQENTEDFKKDIKRQALIIEERVEEYKKDIKLKEKIKRHLTGILKAVK
jgi:hypothetical protein